MTDQELIALLEQKTPDELSADEIDLLRARFAESPELREVLIGQLRMETYLTAALGKIEITPQQIVARAQKQVQKSSGTIIVLALLVCLPLVALAGFVLWTAARRPDQPGQVAQTDPARPISPDQGGGADPAVPSQPHGPIGTDPATTPVEPGSAVPSQPTGPLPPPWQAVLDDQTEPPPFAQVAFQPFDTAKSMPQEDDLRRWFGPAPGSKLVVRKQVTRQGPCGALDGLAQLLCPWLADSVLRLELENYNRLRMHFFAGETGVTLVYYEDQSYRWGAYATTRDPGKAQPKTWALASTDDGRGLRSELRHGGPIELRHRGGELILSRGDIVLLAAPLAAPPTEVFFEGKAAFEGISLIRAQGDPQPLPELPVVLDVPRPAELPWTSSKPKVAEPQLLDDGAVRLAASNAAERVHAWTPLPRRGLQEVRLQLDEVTPGTSVLLTYEKGEAKQLVRFLRDHRSGRTCARITGWNDEAAGEFEQPADKPIGTIGSSCWVKFQVGCGQLRWSLSVDGVHWAEPDYPITNAPPNPTGLGIEVVAKRPDTSLVLRRIVIRELAGLASLATAELREKAPAMPLATSAGAWLAEVLAAQPAGVPTAEWLRAATIQTLGAGPPPELAHALLEGLLDDMATRQLPIEEQSAALTDAMRLVWDLRDGQAMRVSLPRRFALAGLQAARTEQALAWSSVRRAAMSAPQHTYLLTPPDLERSIRHEVVQRANTRQPAETLAFTRQIRLFDQQRFSPLVDWAEALALRDLPSKGAGESVAKLKDAWRDALVEELSKETYNATTELQAVLESEAWDDAARLITSIDAESAPGIAPYLRDRGLLASLPVAVRLTLEDYPPLRQAMAERFGPLAGLRIGQAIAAGDAATVEMAAIQFAGTDAAAEAHRWLGDRALASGWFDRAIVEYRRALRIAPGLAVEIGPRIRLAAAMQGRDEGTPVTNEVRFNDLALSATEFEKLVGEMKARGDQGPLAAGQSSSAPAVPAVKRYDAHARARLDGPIGDRPQDEVGRRTNQFRVPWPDRQIATVIEGDTLYVSNRFQVAAYNLSAGQRMWQSQTPTGSPQKSQDWALIAMRPLLTGRHIFARLLYSSNPLLVCLEKASGKIVWTAEGRSREYLVSDPVIVQGQLGAISVSIQEDQQGVLRWNTYDPETGELQSQRDLIRLRGSWGGRGCCELLPLDDSLVVLLGGLTMSLDATGQVRWVRKHVTLPADDDPRWVLQWYQRPVVAADRMYVAQPGVRTIDCLDVATGRLHWSAVLPEVIGIVGLAGGKLIARTEQEVLAHDAATGVIAWRSAISDLSPFALADDQGVLIAQRERLPDPKKEVWQWRLTWLDAGTGEPVATTPLPNLTDADPRLGPLIPHKDRVFTFFGKGQHDPTRDFVELVPAGPADSPPAANLPLDPWRPRVPPRLREQAARALPDWQLVSGQDGEKTGLLAEMHGERDVLGIRSSATSPIVIGREVAFPPTGEPRLNLRLGNDAGQTWNVQVRLAGQLLKTETITDGTHKDRWKTLVIDLFPALGKEGWLTIQAQSPSGDVPLWIRSVELATNR
ncbi:MAG: PQQ-binding-like beta-propeller repeat protein [Pirellulaceae bacterium]|nr:PQQ-binding-like beta-propeller repeat protein [Pirellulaceae bacterium]